MCVLCPRWYFGLILCSNLANTHISLFTSYQMKPPPPPHHEAPGYKTKYYWVKSYGTANMWLFDLQQFHIVQSNINSSLGQWPHITSPSIRIYSFLWNSPSSKVISSVGSYILFFPDSQTTLSVSFRTYITLFLELLFFITCSPHLSTRRTMSR